MGIGTPALVGIAALSGAIAGGETGVDKMRAAEDWSRTIYQGDVQCLASGLPMPPVEAPPAKSRLPRNGIPRVSHRPCPRVRGGRPVRAASRFYDPGHYWSYVRPRRDLLGFFGAVGGGFISIFLGLLFCLLEVAARAKAFSTAFRRDAWEQFIRRGRFLRRVTRILAVGRQHSLQHHHRRDH